jgi:DNA-binding GntR family transcriptional regulator
MGMRSWSMELQNKAALTAAALRRDILDGVLASGKILNQVWLAKRFGISRTPVREALRRLESEGHVQYRQNCKAVVTGISHDDLLETLEIRQYLEPAIMARSVPNLSDRALRDAEAVLDKCKHVSDLSRLRVMHAKFHSILYEAANRPRMVQIINDNRLSNDRAQARLLLNVFMRKSDRIHRRLLQACKANSSPRVNCCVKAEIDLLRVLMRK